MPHKYYSNSLIKPLIRYNFKGAHYHRKKNFDEVDKCEGCQLLAEDVRTLKEQVVKLLNRVAELEK